MAAAIPPPSQSSDTNCDSHSPPSAPLPPSSTDTNAARSKKREEHLQNLREERLRKQRQEKILRRAIPILLTLPWFIGLLWTSLHPIVSIITGELKCRGQYIDENGLDVHRHRVESYPLQRSAALLLRHQTDPTDRYDDGGMCAAISSMRLPISPSVECLHHEATATIAYDVVKILPAIGPVIESTEAVVIIVGEEGNNDKNNNNGRIRKDWYERSDINASILHLIKKLGNKKDCPWLTKTVFIVSPAQRTRASTINANQMSMENTTISSPNLNSVVDAFLTSYLGDGSSSNVRPLPPDFTFPMIRSVLVLSDDISPTAIKTSQSTEVRILPQGRAGTLPNLDLVFATYQSLQSHPSKTGGRGYDRSSSIYHGNSVVQNHPFDVGVLEMKIGRLFESIGNGLGIKGSSSAIRQYVKDLVGLFSFVAAMVIGPRQPHASALNHGIDALTIQVRIPKNPRASSSSSSSIHPHYADLARCTEHLIRSISNLHERLHHSIAQYTMPSPSKFVSHGEYIYPAILVALPMIVRAATLALRDLQRFQFVYVGRVLGCVSLATLGISMCGIYTNERGQLDEDGGSELALYIAYALSHLLVVLVARSNHLVHPKGVETNMQTEQLKLNESDECKGSLRFIACLLGIYLHAPLLLANYSLGFPSSAFWSPLLATLVLPYSMRMFFSRNKMLLIVSLVVKCVILMAISPPVLLVPRMFAMYTPYVLGVFTPLHMLLAVIWLA